LRQELKAGMNPELQPRVSLDVNPAASANTGLDTAGVLMHELQALESRVGHLEATLRRLLRLGVWLLRLYRRLGYFLLRTPLGPLCHTLMGRSAPEERYRRWLSMHREADIYRGTTAAQWNRADHPLISVVLPVYEPNVAWLMEAVDAVCRQIYPHWELIVVFDGAPPGGVYTRLQSIASNEPRIRPVVAERGGISSALNAGLSEANGPYTAFVDQDDVLEDTALCHIAASTSNRPDILYTDEDYVNERGVPQLPLFKPAWSPALLLSCMYFGHLLVVDTERAREMGGFRAEKDGAQDYDLVLRLTDSGAHIVHIPRVLYHWRRHSRSTALNPDAKPHSHLAGKKALEDTVARRRWQARVEDGPAPNSYKISYPQTVEESAAIIVPTRSPKLLSGLFASLRKTQGGPHREVYVIQHCQGTRADEEIAAIARDFGAVVVEYRGPFNFSLMNNLAAQTIRSKYLVFVNDDVVFHSPQWLEELCAQFFRPEVGVVGALLRYPDGTIQHSGVVSGMGDAVGHAGRYQMGSPFWPWLGMTRNVAAATGACLAVRRTLFEQLGGFNLRYFNNYNDVELCLRAQCAGFEVVLACGPDITHREGKTRRTGTHLQERVAIWGQWGGLLQQPDYFYSPNLSHRLETIDLASQPPATNRAAEK
jgi:O-antigen biosynthesis protein